MRNREGGWCRHPPHDALEELRSDAAHYAEGGIDLANFPHLLGLVASARATLAAIRKAKGTSP